jgi:hypothetical protein
MGIYGYQNYFTDIAVYQSSSCDYEWIHQTGWYTHNTQNLYSRGAWLAILTEVLRGPSQTL